MAGPAGCGWVWEWVSLAEAGKSHISAARGMGGGVFLVVAVLNGPDRVGQTESRVHSPAHFHPSLMNLFILCAPHPPP